MAIEPHAKFTVWSPDSVAECLKVSSALYSKIWNEIVPLYSDMKRSDFNDDFEDFALAKFWKKFTPEEQVELNHSVIEHDKELWKDEQV